MSWYRLPPEIQLIIWETVAEEFMEERRALKIRLDARQEPNSLAASAAVSRDWQGFFERVTFQHLFINSPEVDQFASVISGRKVRLEYIRHLHLHVCLENYDCTQCNKIEDAATVRRNNSTFTRALWMLLAVLATWDSRLVDCTSEEYGMVLELSAGSSSDSQHIFRHFRLYKDYPYNFVSDLDSNLEAYNHHRQRVVANPVNSHGWRNGAWPSAERTRGSTNRVVWSPALCVDFSSLSANTGRQVRRLDIVRGFMIRRRFYRAISPRLILWLLASGLRNIRELRIELWSPAHLFGMIKTTST